jgi:hypothetical protein
VISKWNLQTGIRTDEPVNDTSSADKEKGNLALTFRRVLPLGNSSNLDDTYSEVDIESKELRHLLKEVIGEYIGQSWEGRIVNIRSPFAPIVSWMYTNPFIFSSPEKTPDTLLGRIAESLEDDSWRLRYQKRSSR